MSCCWIRARLVWIENGCWVQERVFLSDMPPVLNRRSYLFLSRHRSSSPKKKNPAHNKTHQAYKQPLTSQINSSSYRHWLGCNSCPSWATDNLHFLPRIDSVLKMPWNPARLALEHLIKKILLEGEKLKCHGHKVCRSKHSNHRSALWCFAANEQAEVIIASSFGL